MWLLIFIIFVAIFPIAAKVLDYAEKKLHPVLFGTLLVLVSIGLFGTSVWFIAYTGMKFETGRLQNSIYAGISLIEDGKIKYSKTLTYDTVQRLKYPKENQLYVVTIRDRIVAVNGKRLNHVFRLSDYEKVYKFYVNQVEFDKSDLYKYVRYNNRISKQLCNSMKQIQRNNNCYNNDDDDDVTPSDLLYSPLSPVSIWWW